MNKKTFYKAVVVLTLFAVAVMSCAPKEGGVRRVPPEGAVAKQLVSGFCRIGGRQNAEIRNTIKIPYKMGGGTEDYVQSLTKIEVSDRGNCKSDEDIYVNQSDVNSWDEGPYPTREPYNPWEPLEATPTPQSFMRGERQFN